MKPLDERFLKPHPDTIVWWAQRAKCRACRHHTLTAGAIEAERCLRQPNMHGKGGPSGVEHGYCIDARLGTGVCGPHAALFEEKEWVRL